MKVKELIEYLNNFNNEDEVYIVDSEHDNIFKQEYVDILDVIKIDSNEDKDINGVYILY